MTGANGMTGTHDAHAPPAVGPPAVGPAHRRLDAFVGRWRGAGRLLEAAPGGEPGSPVTIDDTYAWLPGGHFLEHRGRMGFGGAGALESVQLIGVGAAGAYPSHQFDSMGYCRTYPGRVDGDTWTFEGRWERATIVLGDGGASMRVRWERRDDGGPWGGLCEYEARKVGAGGATDDERARLAAFVGSWHTEGEVAAADGAPAARYHATDDYALVPGGHFMVHRWDAHMPDGRVQGVEVVGPDGAGGYRMLSFDSAGQAAEMRGSADGDRWTYEGDGVRFTGGFDAPDRWSGAWERRDGGGAWTRWMTVRSTRAR